MSNHFVLVGRVIRPIFFSLAILIQMFNDYCMKNLFAITLSTLILFPLTTQACPNLAGEYYCVINDGHREPWLDVMTIQQSTSTDSPGVTNFTTSYRSVAGWEENFSADDSGIADGWGWIIKCKGDRVMSVRDDFSALSELFLDKTDQLVRTYNYNVQQTCSRKN